MACLLLNDDLHRHSEGAYLRAGHHAYLWSNLPLNCSLPVPWLQVSGWQGVKQLHASHGEAVVYKGMVDCFVRTVREEGVSALFKVRIGMACTGAAAVRGCGRYGQRQWSGWGQHASFGW